MKTAIVIIIIGMSLYYWLYGVGTLSQFLHEQLRAQETTGRISTVAQNVEEQTLPAAQKYNQWKTFYRSPPACQNPETELKKLECKNMEDNARQAFNRKWDAGIANK